MSCISRRPSAGSYPVFVISNITEDVVQVQDAAVAVLQPVNLQPVAGVLKEEEKDSAPGGGVKGLESIQTHGRRYDVINVTAGTLQRITTEDIAALTVHINIYTHRSSHRS